MSEKSRPLWQLLLLTNKPNVSVQLTCEECFTLLEYDAELLVGGAALDEIQPAVRHHLSLCEECRKKIDEWMGKQEIAQSHLHVG
jgi:hypothetical protein